MDAHVADAVERGAAVVVGGARGGLSDPALLAGDGARRRAARLDRGDRRRPWPDRADRPGIGSLEEAIEQTNSQSFGLMAAIFTGDLAAGLRFADAIHDGTREHQRDDQLLGGPSPVGRPAVAPRAASAGWVGPIRWTRSRSSRQSYYTPNLRAGAGRPA